MPYDRSTFITRTPEESMCFDFMAAKEEYLADKIFTPKSVEKSTTKIYQADKSKLRYVVGEGFGTNSEPPLIDEQFFSTNVTLAEFKYGREINPKDERDADAPVRMMMGNARGAALCTLAMLNEREKKAFDLVTTTGNYTAALTSAISSGSRWNETNGDPEADSITAHQAIKDKCGMRANALAIGDATLDKLQLSPAFRERTKYTGAGKVPVDYIKQMFGVEHLFVGSARIDQVIEGGTAAPGGLWADYALMYVYNPSPAVAPDPGAVSYGHMYMLKAPFWTDIFVDTKRVGPAGPMRRITVGTEYKLGAGYVAGSGDGDFNGGYLFRTVVA
jgi:hypothetical protein